MPISRNISGGIHWNRGIIRSDANQNVANARPDRKTTRNEKAMYFQNFSGFVYGVRETIAEDLHA
jgi:hypothetical protein